MDDRLNPLSVTRSLPSRQLHHHQTHGAESATVRQGQALDTRSTQGRCMGRWFPRRVVSRL